MKLSLGMMNSVRGILSIFNGATTITLGDVALPVKVGQVTQQVLFSIIENLGPYIAIMGVSLPVLDKGCPFDLPLNDQLFN